MVGQEDVEGLYCSVHEYAGNSDYSEQEKLAIEYAERFCLQHDTLDEEFFERLRAQFSEAEIVDLAVCCSMFVGLGRMLAVFGVEQEEPMRL
ncbi:MAG: hypothetical protein ABGY28_01235 [bacterium]|nr:hypothetical protein [Candidatus Binatota bacterium]